MRFFNLLFVLGLLPLGQTAFAGFPVCSGNVHFSNSQPKPDTVAEDFIVSARDGFFGMSKVSVMKFSNGNSTELEAARYYECKYTVRDPQVESICRLPDDVSYEHFPRFIGLVREGSRTKPGSADVYFLEEGKIVGKPIGSIHCEAF